MSSDLIKWKNNLFEARRNGGVTWDISGVAVISLAEETAFTEIESQLESVWMIRINDDEILEICTTGKENGFLCFMREEEAQRFSEQIDAYIEGKVSAIEIDTVDIRATSGETEMLIGIVPTQTLLVYKGILVVSPTMLGGMS